MTELCHCSDSYFIPNKNFSLPIEKEGDLIKFSIFEASCSFRGKTSQIQKIMNTLNFYNYSRFNFSLDLFPTIIAFDKPSHEYSSDYNVLSIKEFPDWTLFYLKNKLDSKKNIKLSGSDTNLLYKVIEEDNFDYLNFLIFDEVNRQSSSLTNLRGKVAEWTIQEIIKKSAPDGVQVLYNGNLANFFSKIGVYEYINPEIDALGVFYESSQYRNHLENLLSLPYIETQSMSDVFSK